MLKEKPGSQLAYLPSAAVDPLAECLVSFANGSGGLIVLGVDERGRPTENIWEEEAEAALLEAAAICHPPVPTEWRTIETPQGMLIGIQVNRSIELHTLDDGRIFVRNGPENRALTGDEVRSLVNSKHTAEFETEIVPGARGDDLDATIIRDYLERREARGAPRVLDPEQLLFEIGATDRDGIPTMIGLLLYGKNPQLFFRKVV